MNELDEFKRGFTKKPPRLNKSHQPPSSLENLSCYRQWLERGRQTIIAFIRLNIESDQIMLPQGHLKKTFRSKVFLLDTLLAWVKEWECAYQTQHGPRNESMDAHLMVARTNLIMQVTLIRMPCCVTTAAEALKLVSDKLAFPGAVPNMVPSHETLSDSEHDENKRSDTDNAKEIQCMKQQLRSQMEVEFNEILKNKMEEVAREQRQQLEENEERIRDMKFHFSKTLQQETMRMEEEFKDTLEQSKQDVASSTNEQVKESELALKRLRKQVKKEVALRRDAEHEKRRLIQQLAEIESHEYESEEREHAVRISAGEQPNFVSFEDSMDTQIAAFVKQVEHLYSLFDAVFFDPRTFQFSLNDALFQCFMMEPNMTTEEARKKSTRSMNKNCTRIFREGKRVASHETSKRAGTFLPYIDLCKCLVKEKGLTVVPNAIIGISAHAISPSPTFILALMQRLREIATGKVNIVLIRCILGLEKTQEFDKYLEQLVSWNSRNQLCDENVCARGKRKQSKCGRRVNINQEKCSYHLKRIKT